MSVAGVGLALDQALDGTMHIIDVICGGAAAQDGRIQKGDILVGINGQIIAGRSMDDIKRMVVGPVGSPVELFIQRGGARFPVQLVRGGVSVASRGPHAPAPLPAPSSRVANHAARPMSGSGQRLGGEAAGQGGGPGGAADARARAAEAAMKRFEQAPKGFSKSAADKLKQSSKS